MAAGLDKSRRPLESQGKHVDMRGGADALVADCTAGHPKSQKVHKQTARAFAASSDATLAEGSFPDAPLQK